MAGRRTARNSEINKRSIKAIHYYYREKPDQYRKKILRLNYLGHYSADRRGRGEVYSMERSLSNISSSPSHTACAVKLIAHIDPTHCRIIVTSRNVLLGRLVFPQKTSCTTNNRISNI